jgi:hypothetical protein
MAVLPFCPPLLASQKVQPKLNWKMSDFGHGSVEPCSLPIPPLAWIYANK